jgi:archaellum component FlaG (FlaF/FlaG flagellin family)
MLNTKRVYYNKNIIKKGGDKKMRNECMMVSIAIAVFACLFLCTPAMADYNYAGWQVTNRVNGTVNGGVFFDYEPWPGPQTAGTMNLNASFDVPSGTVKHAFLYTGIWGGNPTSTYWHNVTFNGNYTANGLGPIHVEGNSDTNPNVWASGCGKHWWWYNVTNLTNAGATNTARTKKINGTAVNDGRVYGILLVVVYEGGDAPKNVRYWINDGCDALYAGTHDWGTTNFSGMVDNCSVTDANLTVAWMTAALWKDDAANFSDHTLDTSMVQSDTFQMTTWNVTSYVKSSGNDAWYSRGYDSYVSVPNAILVLEREEVEKPDLNVSSISVNPGDTHAEDTVRVYVNESNNVSAVVWNNGMGDADGFNVCFDADGTKIGCVEVAGLPAGANATVTIDWTPSCADYPVMPGFPPTSKAFWINVTADCNCTDCPNCPDDGSNGKITESDETNNKLETYIDDRQWYGPFERIGGVANNGYKAKHCDCNTTNKPLYQFEYYSEVTGGGFTYNTSGRRPTIAPGESSTRAHHIDIPGSATVKEARLYVYWWNAWGEHPARPVTGWMADLSVNFTHSSGEYYNFTTPDASYNDAKGFGKWQNVKGTYAYNVTSLVTGSGDYNVVITNIDPDPDYPYNSTTLLGEMLFVVYENPNAHKKMQLWWLEGNDYLMQGNITHPSSGGYKFGVSEEEATATLAFPGSVDLARVTNATLFSVVAQGMEDGMDMLFNGNVIKTDAWNTDTEANPQTDVEYGSRINIESVDIKPSLASSGNNMGFRDTGTTGMQASNAFLVITYEEEEEEFFDTGSSDDPYPSIFGTHNGTIMVDKKVTVNSMYTYPCSGTGGHTEFVKIWNKTAEDYAEAHWDGYRGDYHNISLNITLKKGVIYNYTIRTGSYPQIHHREELPADGGVIKCAKFTDANGKEYDNWIPAIKLY